MSIFEIISNTPVAEKIYELVLRGDTSGFTAPGQFANILPDGFYLRRPISVCDIADDRLTLIYRTVGGGTEALSGMNKGDSLDLLTGLGNGFDTAKSGGKPVLVGGGVGIPPLYLLAKRLIAEGKTPTVLLGFNSAADSFYTEKFAALGVPVTVCTADGSFGKRGFVTAALPETAHDYIFSCGPIPMMEAVCGASAADGQFSMEERMGCGFGACMGCTCHTKSGAKRVCADGPVFEREEIIWQTFR